MDVLERLNRRFGDLYDRFLGGKPGGGRGLRPRDILRRILAAMESSRREGLDGRTYVPNVYTLQVSVANDDERQYLRTFLGASELAAAVAEEIDARGYDVRGLLVFTVEEMPAPAVTADRVRIRCHFDANANGVSAPKEQPVRSRPTPPRPEPDDGEEELGTVPFAAAALASLTVYGPDGGLKGVHPLGAGGARVGRGRQAGNDIVLDGDRMISKRHTRIAFEHGRFVAYDENSTNGTLLHGKPVPPGAPAPLQSGDELRVGETLLVFRYGSAGAGATPGGKEVKEVQVPGGTDAGPPPVSGASFRLVAGDGEVYPLAGAMTVGRSLTGDVVLLGNGVSTQHARLTTRGDAVYVEDLGAPGGTYVNGERIPSNFPVALYDEDQVAFGEVLLRLERGEVGGDGRGAIWGG
jgi:pSer/pThr/pTyr-binding forkhead associated (FHA) protein